MRKFNNSFLNARQELMWKAFKGECGKLFAGHPFFMEEFMAEEFDKQNLIEKDGREL